MGTVYDTTDYIDTTIAHKSKLTKNFAKDNYWIEGYQNKINRSWRFATDVVDIQEQDIDRDENNYIKINPTYHDIEVRITSAYDEKGMKLSDDYKNIIYKDVEHKQLLGQKYVFDETNFGGADNKPSVWLTINYDSVHLGANAILKRCSCLLGFLINGNTEEHYEPAILDYDAKYTINYYQ